MLALDHHSFFRRLTLVVGAGALVLAMSSCGGSDKAEGPQPKTNIGEPANVDKTSTTTTTATSTTAATPVGLPGATEVAAALYDSWKANDRPGATKVAEPTAVDGMFATAPGDYRLYNHCNTGEFDAAACLYRGDPGTIQFSMEKRGPNWVVVTAIFSEA